MVSSMAMSRAVHIAAAALKTEKTDLLIAAEASVAVGLSRLLRRGR